MGMTDIENRRITLNDEINALKRELYAIQPSLPLAKKNHQRKHYQRKRRENNIENLTYVCQICAKVFSGKSELARHNNGVRHLNNQAKAVIGW